LLFGGAEVSGTLAVGNGGTGLYHLLLVVYLEVIMLERYQWLLLQILLLLGATFVTNATNATNATNTVNVGVTNDAATATPVFLSWVSAASVNTKVSSANLSFVPSTGILSAGFSGNGAALTSHS
jgi:hypothetical protein